MVGTCPPCTGQGSAWPSMVFLKTSIPRAFLLELLYLVPVMHPMPILADGAITGKSAPSTWGLAACTWGAPWEQCWHCLVRPMLTLARCWSGPHTIRWINIPCWHHGILLPYVHLLGIADGTPAFEMARSAGLWPVNWRGGIFCAAAASVRSGIGLSLSDPSITSERAFFLH